MKLLIHGICGHMGKEVLNIAKNDKTFDYICGIDNNFDSFDYKDIDVYKNFGDIEKKIDIIIDFSNHLATKNLINYAVNNNIPLVIATTGQTEDEKKIIIDASEKIPIFFSANYSMGVNLLIDLAKKSAKVMEDAEIEIVEIHHDRKIDAPSGTAIAIANAIKDVRDNATIVAGRNGEKKRTKEEIGISSIRMGNIVGTHEVMIATPYETITLKHDAYNRTLFAEGAIAAAKFLYGKSIGFYNMKNILE